MDSSGPMGGPQMGGDKTARSIFVGNIPYEATEEKLMELFSKAGPVVGFRLVYDRESGKPKGYGFCEYSNPATSASALRNLQNIEFNGRPLRIGPAAGEQNSAELALSNTTLGPPVESPYGDRVEPDEAPEAISRAVASLPPEQMYELMKQMKLCIQNNPNEARNMLLQNPQLAYALLQAQIVMKIVDPKVAIAMLNRSNDQIPAAMPEQPAPAAVPPPSPQQQQQQPLSVQPVSGPGPLMPSPSSIPMPPPVSMSGPPVGMAPQPGGGYPGVGAPMMQQGQNMGGGPSMPGLYRQPPSGSHPNPVQAPVMGMYGQPPQVQPAPTGGAYPGPGIMRPPMLASGQMQQGAGGPPAPAPVGMGGPPTQMRTGTMPGMGIRPGQQMMGVNPPAPVPPPSIPSAVGAAGGAAASFLASQGEQEKAALIMQVLQLSDQQIALLPDDQRRSILILKEQLARSGP